MTREQQQKLISLAQEAHVNAGRLLDSVNGPGGYLALAHPNTSDALRRILEYTSRLREMVEDM